MRSEGGGRGAGWWLAPGGRNRRSGFWYALALLAGSVPVGLVPLALPVAPAVAGIFSSWSVGTGHELTQRGETLASASCATASHCVAVGTYVTGAGTRTAISVTLSDGRLTEAYPTLPPPASVNLVPYFGGISCRSVSSCLAVGYFAAPVSISGAASTAAGQEGFALALTNGRWQSVVLPLPSSVESDAAEVLRGVSCPSVSSCVAVGDAFPTTGRQPLILTEASGAWTATDAPLPGDAASRAHANLNAVDCGSPTTGLPGAAPSATCIAIGTYSTAGGSQQGLILSGSGGAWAAMSAPLPAHGDEADALNAISCTGSGVCVVAGAYDVNGSSEGLILRLAGGDWTASAGPDAAVADAIYGLSCPSTSSCVAVGTYLDSSIDQQGLILRLTGSRWKMTTSSPPPGAMVDPGAGLGTTLNAVSCVAQHCVAVGTYVGGLDDQVAVLLETPPR